MPDDPGKATVVRICAFHGTGIVLGKRSDRDGWNQIVVNMVQRGTQGSDDEFAELVDYLTNNVSKINVNKATSKEHQAGLDISDKEAAVILHYHDEKGKFKTIDDLKQVPGLDTATIDAKRVCWPSIIMRNIFRGAKGAVARCQDKEKPAISSGGALDTAPVLREFLKKSILLTVSAAISFAADLPDGPGKAATIRVCSKCHAIEKAVSLRQDEDGWTDTISKMVKMGAQGSDDDFNAVLEYLTKNFGPEVAPPININKADSVDLESSLVLTRTEAAALIRYRTEKGPFKTIDDLRNIPGLDFKKIERQKSRITF